MEQIPGLILLGKSVEKLKVFVVLYLLLISAIGTNLLLNQPHHFYDNRLADLTLGTALDFMLSSQGVLFIVMWAFVVALHCLLAPLLIRVLPYLVRLHFIFLGNLFFWLIYIV